MILVILVLGILMAVGGTILYYKLDDDNNKQIKELKCKAINTSVIRWWLYFGK